MICVDFEPGGVPAGDHVNLIILSSSSSNCGLSNGMSGGSVACFTLSFFSSATFTSTNVQSMTHSNCAHWLAHWIGLIIIDRHVETKEKHLKIIVICLIMQIAKFH